MIIDISQALQAAHRHRDSWSEALAEEAIDLVVGSDPSLEKDWEPGDESWARALVGPDVAAMVSVGIPLAILFGSPGAAFEAPLTQRGLTVVLAPDFEAEVFSVDREALREVFPVVREFEGRREMFDVTRFSPSHLWWITL